MALSNPTGGFIWGAGGAQLTPEDIAKQREMEAALVAKGVDTSPVGSWTQGMARVADALAGSVRRGRLDNAQARNIATDDGLKSPIVAALTGGDASADVSGSPGLSSASIAPTSAPITPGDPNDIQTQFLNTVKSGYDRGDGTKLAVTNPYGLAAVAATGKAESGWDPKNAGGTWADGKNPAGGIMSWNGPRLANLQKFAGGSNGSPQQQGQFFLQENPDLITALNGAKSIDEAQHLMNNAWAFKGYDQPGNSQATHRLALANGYLPQFQGSDIPAAAAIQQQTPIGGQQVASLDPSSGMGSIPAAAAPAPGQPPASMAIPVPTSRPTSPMDAPLDPATATPDQMLAALGPGPAPQINPQIAAALQNPGSSAPAASGYADPTVTTAAQKPASPPYQNVVQALQSSQQADPRPSAVSPAIIKALSSPYASPQTKQLATILLQRQQASATAQQQFQFDQKKSLYEQQLKQADPVYQQTLRKAQYENDHLGQVSPDTQATLAAAERKAKTDADNAWVQADHEQDLKNTAPVTPTDQARLDLDRQKFEAETKKGQWQKLTDGRLYNETSGEFRDAPPPVAGSTPMKPDDISSIRKEVQQLPSYKNIAQAAPIYKSMVETFGRNTKASDLNMVYGLGKIMDPTSVVREGEVDMARNTASWPDYLKGALETLKGGAALDPQTRTAIMKEAHGRMTGYSSEFKQSMTQYQGIAKRYNLNAEDIIPPFEDFPEVQAKTEGAPAPEGIASDVWGIMTPEERKLWQK